jgi:hypothetical protein
MFSYTSGSNSFNSTQRNQTASNGAGVPQGPTPPGLLMRLWCLAKGQSWVPRSCGKPEPPTSVISSFGLFFLEDAGRWNACIAKGSGPIAPVPSAPRKWSRLITSLFNVSFHVRYGSRFFTATGGKTWLRDRKTVLLGGGSQVRSMFLKASARLLIRLLWRLSGPFGCKGMIGLSEAQVRLWLAWSIMFGWR